MDWLDSVTFTSAGGHLMTALDMNLQSGVSYHLVRMEYVTSWGGVTLWGVGWIQYGDMV